MAARALQGKEGERFAVGAGKGRGRRKTFPLP